MRSLISILELSVEELDQLIDFLDGQIGDIHQILHYLAPFTAR